MFGWHAPHGKVTVLGQGPVTSRPGRQVFGMAARADSFCSLSAGQSDRTLVCRPSRNATHPQNRRNPGWQSNVNGRLGPGATGRTDWPVVGASPARTAGTRSTESTTRTFRHCAGSSPSAARSARAGSRERAAAIRARSRAQSSARASLRCCRTSPRARTSVGNAASGPAVARAETGSGPERTATRELDAPSEPRNPRPRHEPKPQRRRDRHLAHDRTPDCPLSGHLYTRPQRRVRGRPSRPSRRL